MKRLIVAAGLALASVGVVTLPASADVHTQVTCDRQGIVNVRAAQLHAKVPFNVTTVREDAWGVAYEDHADISNVIPCDYALITSVVNHEFVHTLQYNDTQYNRDQHVGGNLEIIADCASRMLGSTRTPYIDQAHGVCPKPALMWAKELLMRAGLPAHVVM